jgi:hypothetical protein
MGDRYVALLPMTNRRMLRYQTTVFGEAPSAARAGWYASRSGGGQRRQVTGTTADGVGIEATIHCGGIVM